MQAFGHNLISVQISALPLAAASSLIEEKTLSFRFSGVGGEFQPSFETGYTGGGAHLIFLLLQLCQLSQLSRFCQFQDLIDFTDYTLMALKPPQVPGYGF